MKNILLLAFIFLSSLLHSQINDKLIFEDYLPGYYENYILKDASAGDEKISSGARKFMQADFSSKNFPVDTSKYKKIWHTPPVSQGITGTCWCFATTSMMESEIKRITGNEFKLSEMWTVYWEYVERATDFINTRGATYFAEGSEANAIPKIWKKYGIVPRADYEGKPKGMPYFDHRQMVSEMENFLNKIKENNEWDLQNAIESIKAILNHYMGTPPDEIVYGDYKVTPKQFLEKFLKLNMNDYYSFMSTKEFSYNEKHELVENDNWWHDANYYNLSLDDYMSLIIKAIDNGYGTSLCGDVSEPGYDRSSGVSIIPDFDISAENINEDSRVFRLKNETTTDDHCMHLIGYYKNEAGYWFLVKDSGSGGFDSINKGYRIFHEDYIKLKMMNVLFYKYAAKEILDKIIK